MTPGTRRRDRDDELVTTEELVEAEAEPWPGWAERVEVTEPVERRTTTASVSGVICRICDRLRRLGLLIKCHLCRICDNVSRGRPRKVVRRTPADCSDFPAMTGFSPPIPSDPAVLFPSRG
jgi:hypothetical protein